MSTLTVHQLHQSYGAEPVLAGVNLQVPAGSLTAVLGQSGCGKTTLLRSVAGFLRFDSGTISIAGQTVSDGSRHVPAQRRQVGYVPQEGGLFPHLTVADNITFGLRRRLRRQPDRSTALLQLVGLDSALADRYPHQLSGGQQQRVALARALAPEPALVLLDEPFSSLDAGLREDTGRAVAAALRTAGATALLVTHDQNEALSLADQVAIMRDGRIAQTGAPTAVYTDPIDPGIARLLGAAVLLPGHADGEFVHCALGPLPLAGQVSGAVTVLIRPEQIRLDAAAADSPVTGRVSGVRYFGHDAAVELTLTEENTTVTARITAGQIPAVDSRAALTVHGPVTAFHRHGQPPAAAELSS